MGFKLGKITHGKQGHKWTNDPDVYHQKCVTCGCRKDSIYRNAKGGRDYTYYDYNGNKVEELPKCRSVYDLLNEDDKMMKKKVYFATPVNGRMERTFEEKKLAALKRCIEVRQLLAREQPDWIVTFSFTVCPINEHIDEPMAMAGCYELLRRCDMIVLDRNWTNSEGCNKERMFAKRHGIFVLTLNDVMKLSEVNKTKVRVKL